MFRLETNNINLIVIQSIFGDTNLKQLSTNTTHFNGKLRVTKFDNMKSTVHPKSPVP